MHTHKLWVHITMHNHHHVVEWQREKRKRKGVWEKRARTRKRVWCLLVTLWLIMMVSGLWWLQNGEWLDLGLCKKHSEGAKTVVCVDVARWEAVKHSV